MKIIDGLLAELEQEAVTTRRVLERIPQAHLSWKPHPKSMSLGQLALHVATVPGNVAELASHDTIPRHRSSSRSGNRSRTGAVAHRQRSEASRVGDATMQMAAMWRAERLATTSFQAASRVFGRSANPVSTPRPVLVYLRLLDQSVPSGTARRQREPFRGCGSAPSASP